MPFEAAVDRLGSKTAIASTLRSDEWAAFGLGLRDRAFFSAGVDSLRTVATMQQKIDDALRISVDAKTAFTDRAKFIADMRATLGALPGDSKQLTDITSTTRLGLIYDFQLQDAREFGRWQASQDPDILNEFPAQELIRVEEREEPRDWANRWAEAGGSFFDGRMIARKDDPVWTKISRFGRPWPPYDFGSGMGIEDIDRDEAEQLGLVAPGEQLAPQEADFNQALEASVPNATPALLDGFREIFGDQVDVSPEGRIVWHGQRVQDLARAAASDATADRSLDLGRATAEAAAKAKAIGADLGDARLVIGASDLRSAAAKPLSPLDAQLVPHVWRSPDGVSVGADGALEFSARMVGRTVRITFAPTIAGAWTVRSFTSAKIGGKL
ncbi:hypothetical protein [Opitutus sp. ER46]|uniref:hypothetical protein n=1 Tax=Opitutus sp. ER46 TaxID=2161864 RepID=UPI0011B1F794|nr:hypothetical protein [Opitutus sp. ER46]